MKDFLRFDGITKHYGALKALDNVSFEIRKGEFFSLLGPSGCGKTTLLRLVAGFDLPDTGKVFLNGEDITGLPPQKRKVNTIFQNYALFPHLTVWENIAFGPKVSRWSPAEITAEVEAMLALTHLEEHCQKRPAQLSGGQKQRVAIARALINKPQVLLLDEPLAALDLKLRQRLLVELDRIQRQVGTTFLYVTHDQGEAMSLSDTIGVMREGRIEQLGSPAAIYEAPRTGFVADFIGDANFFYGQLDSKITPGLSTLSVEGLPRIVCKHDQHLIKGQTVVVSVRPEKLSVSKSRPDDAPLLNAVQGTVEDVHYLGSYTKYWVRVERLRIVVYQPHHRMHHERRGIGWDDRVWLSWHADDGYTMETQGDA